MDNSTDGLNILSMAVQEHSKHSSCAELKSKTPAGYIVKNEAIQKHEKQTISHRQIEKRRRDRINNTLWMLKDLVPAAKRKFTSGSGRLEKADLLEMTIQHIKEVHKSLTTFEEKEQRQPFGNSEVLNESYSNGFKDGMLHALDIMKKMNILTPNQTELLLKENIMAEENKKHAELVRCSNLAEAIKASQNDLIPGNIGFKSLDADSEMGRPDSKSKPGSNVNIEEIPNFIKSEELPATVAETSNSFAGNAVTNQRSLDENIERANSLASFPFHGSPFHKQPSLHANNGTQNPILLPVYALHASGTHYVPVFLPPSSILPTDPG